MVPSPLRKTGARRPHGARLHTLRHRVGEFRSKWGELVIDNVRLRRKLRLTSTRLRELRMIAKGLLSTRHPIDVHLIPIRRCNLSCTYCNEYDDFSKPVPTAELFRRVDRLASFGTTAITVLGGEP